MNMYLFLRIITSIKKNWKSLIHYILAILFRL